MPAARPVVSLLAALAAAAALTGGAGAAGGGISGSWRVYSARLYYDAGGGSGFASSLRPLTISGSRWHWGTSSGAVSLRPASAADWKRWGIQPYGPTEKVVFSNWARGRTADGPVETSAGRVVFLWAVYRVGPPTVSAAGTVFVKFGRQNP